MTHLCVSTFTFSLVYIISAVAAPVFGFLIDRTGRNIVWMSVGVFATLACHGTLCFTFINPYIPMVNLRSLTLLYRIIIIIILPFHCTTLYLGNINFFQKHLKYNCLNIWLKPIQLSSLQSKYIR